MSNEEQQFTPWASVPRTLKDLLDEWHMQIDHLGDEVDRGSSLLEEICNFDEAPYIVLTEHLIDPFELISEQYSDDVEALEEEIAQATASPLRIKKINRLVTDALAANIGRKMASHMQTECDELLVETVFKLRAFKFSWNYIARLLEITPSAAHQRYAEKIAARLEATIDDD